MKDIDEVIDVSKHLIDECMDGGEYRGDVDVYELFEQNEGAYSELIEKSEILYDECIEEQSSSSIFLKFLPIKLYAEIVDRSFSLVNR